MRGLQPPRLTSSGGGGPPARPCKAACRRRSVLGRGEGWGVRDPLLNEALRRLAAEAATRFTTLVASGDQIPFDVAEQAGPEEAFFHSYLPLTARDVR